jgi:hypothetical protein
LISQCQEYLMVKRHGVRSIYTRILRHLNYIVPTIMARSYSLPPLFVARSVRA